MAARATDWKDLVPLTPLSEADLEWLEPRLASGRPGDGLRAFCLDGYDARCRAAGFGEPYDRLAARAGRYPSLVFMPVEISMLMTFAAARWVDPESPLPVAVHDLHRDAVFEQMSGGIVGRPLVLSANGSFARFIHNMTMFPKFSVNFGSIACTESRPGVLTVQHDDFYSWMDTIMGATYRALGQYFGLDLEIRIEVHSPWSMDHHLAWDASQERGRARL